MFLLNECAVHFSQATAPVLDYPSVIQAAIRLGVMGSPADIYQGKYDSCVHPARFVTVCCLYSGALFLLTQILLYPSQLNVPVIRNSGAAVCILFVGLYQLYTETAEKYPSEYGLLTSGIAFLSLMVTVIVLAVLTDF